MEEESLFEVDTARSKTSVACDDGIPIQHPKKPCKCGLCGSKSNDLNPIATAASSDAASIEGEDPCIQWAKYRKVQTASGVARVPVVYRLLGFPLKYGSPAEYIKKVEAKQVDHDEFLKSREEYLKKMKAGSAGCRTKKRDKEDLKTISTLKTVNKQGVKFEGPLMEFVELSEWDVKEDGVLDESKVVDEAGLSFVIWLLLFFQGG